MHWDKFTSPSQGQIEPILGMIDPNMGTKSSAATSIADALFTKSQQRVLATLFGQPERSFFANEIVRLATSGSGAVQRELQALESSGLVTSHRQGNQKHYQANPAAPIFDELCQLVAKTFGVADWLRRALNPLAPEITYACIYGSVAKGGMHATSDIDVLIVADDLPLETVYEALAPVELQLSRKINPTLFKQSEFLRRRKSGQSFVANVLAGARIPLLGILDVDL